jgi:hypothetical protein
MNKKSIFAIALVVNVLFVCMLCLGSCTYNVSMAHTEGTATDVIDDNLTNTPDISPTITPGALG